MIALSSRGAFHGLAALLLVLISRPLASPLTAATADLSGLDATARSFVVRAALAADPDRAREILHEFGTDWCGMDPRTRRPDPRRLHAFGACPTEGPSDLPANRDACIPTANTPFKTVRLKFNVFRNNDGSAAAATQSQVDDQMAELNAAYAPARIRFVHTTAFINDSRFRSLSYFVNSEEDAMKRTHADRPDQQHNIYVVGIEPDPERGGSLLGVSTFPWDSIAVQAGGGTILDDDSIGAGQKTLVHELGHALGLWHTHHGVLEVDQCSACWERADGRNADTTGDFCSDTPPTPVNYKCQAPGGSDPCSGRTWGATAPQNYMGYAPDSCYTEFTRQQAGRMNCWIQDRLQGWLVNELQTTVTLSATDPQAAEAGPDTGTFTISRSGDTTLALPVRFTRAGTATQGTDYLPIGDSVTLPAGSSSVAVRITPIDDTTPEPDETVVLTLAPGAGYQIGSPATGTITIRDNDAGALPTVTVVATDPNAAEAGGNSGTFTFNRSGSTTAPLTLLVTVGGTAAPADYSPAIPGSLIIPAGSATATVIVTPVDDAITEPDETVVLTLANGTGYLVGTPNSATVTIADNDATSGGGPLLAEAFDGVAPPALPPGWSAESIGPGGPWRTVAFNGPTPPNLVFAESVDSVSDLRLVSPAFTVPSGGARMQFIHGFLLEEAYDGGVLEISIAGGPFTDILAAGGSFESGGYTGSISFEDGSPIAGRPAWTGDSEVNIQSVVRFPAAAAGQSVRARWRLASDAGIAEGGWGFDNLEIIPLDGGAGTTLVSVTAPDPNAAEAGLDPGLFTISRTGNLTTALSLNLAVGGSATPGADYTPLPGSILIPAGSASVDLNVIPREDSEPEPSETIILTVATGPGYAPGTPASATVTILDNDGGGGGIVFAEAFDTVSPPNLPAGWSAVHAGAGLPWETTPFDGLTPPNVAFALGPDTTSDNSLVSPGIAIATVDARLAFDHGYILEEGYDGGVLEISIAGGPFLDILAAGGTFLAAGYDGIISTTDGSAIAGRRAWTGDSGTNLRTEVRLPATAAGSTIRLRWRLVTDGGIGEGGWGLDSIVITEAGAGTSTPTVFLTVTDSVASEYGPDHGEFAVTRTGDTSAPLTVSFGLGGNATPGADFNPFGGSVTIPAGSSTAPIRILPINDATIEGTETVALSLQAPPGHTLGQPAAGEVRILDNGTAAPVVFGANFDNVTPPAVPGDWATRLDGLGVPWSSIPGSLLTPPNRLYATAPDGISDNFLVSPPLPIATASAQLLFVHEYQLEAGYDGGVLEIAIGSGPDPVFRDILDAGGSFVAGGYDGPLSRDDLSPIAGRNAWTGHSGGPRVTRVNLPATAAGQTIRLRWRCATDAGVPDLGWFLDTIALTEGNGTDAAADLALSLTGTPSPVVAQNQLTYTIAVTNLTGVVARDVVISNTIPSDVRLVSASASQGSVTGTNLLVARLGLLNSRAAASVTIVVIPADAGTVNTEAQVIAADPDPNPANNRATLTTPVLANASPTLAFTNASPIVVTEAAGPASPYPSSLVVSGFQGAVARVAVTLHGLSHTFPDDLDILLVGPRGQKVILMSDAGGDGRFSITHATLTFADDAPGFLPDRSAIVDGSYRPTDFEAGDTFPAPAPAGPYAAALGTFLGQDPNGTWQLFIADDEAKDSGRLAGGWSLSLVRAAANATPPSIVSQPASQIVAENAPVTFAVTASGSPPLNYQWRFNGADLPGANGATLTIPQVLPALAGDYQVAVRNDAGIVLSQVATLVVTTQARQVRLASVTTGPGPGAQAAVPIALAAQGNENRVRFSVAFDPERLAFSSVNLAPDATRATLSFNVNQLESGRLGLQFALPSGEVFPAQTLTLASLQFETRGPGQGVVTLSMVDAPLTRDVTAANGSSLPADFLPGSVTYGAPSDAPNLGGITLSASGLVQFSVNSKPGAMVRIEYSPDLRAWNQLSEIPNPTGTLTFTDPQPAWDAARFYRAVQLP